jgi:hypothetical protein
MVTTKNESIAEKVEKLERKSDRVYKEVQDFQAGIGKAVLPFQKFKTYLLSFIMITFGVILIVFTAQREKSQEGKESDYIIGSVLVGLGGMLVLSFYIYSNFVLGNKNAQIFNSFMFQSNSGRSRRF